MATPGNIRVRGDSVYSQMDPRDINHPIDINHAIRIIDRTRVLGLNDAKLYRVVSSGSEEDVLRMLQFPDSNMCYFSDRVLNWCLTQACHMGHEILIRFLIENGSRLEVRDFDGNTPLIICCMKGLPGAVKMLLRSGANVNAQNSNGDTGLMLSRSKEVIGILLKHSDIDINRRNNSWYTALMLAIETLNLGKARQLIDSGASPNSHLDFVKRCYLPTESLSLAASILDFSFLGELAESVLLKDPFPLGIIRLDHFLPYTSCEDTLPMDSLDPGPSQAHTIKIRTPPADMSSMDAPTEVTPPWQFISFYLYNMGFYTEDLSPYESSPSGSAQPDYRRLVNISGESAFRIAKRKGVGLLVELLFLSYMCRLHPIVLSGEHYDFIGSEELFDYNIFADQELLNTKPDLLCYVLRTLQTRGAAVGLRQLNLVIRLCQAGMDVKRCPECKQSPMTIALDIGNPYLIDILRSFGASVPRRFSVRAGGERFISLVPLLMEQGAQLDHIDKNGNFFPAIVSPRFAKFTVSSYAKGLLNLTSQFDLKYIVSKLLAKRQMKSLRFLLEYYRFESEIMIQSNPLLIFDVVRIGDAHVVDLLIDAGADVNMVHCGKTPLMIAAHTRVIELLLKKGGASVKRRNESGISPLMLALNTSWTNPKVIDMLIAAGCNVNKAGRLGLTPLLVAAQKFDIRSCSVLLKRGADVNAGNVDYRNHMTPLSVALDKWYPDKKCQLMAIMFLKYGAALKHIPVDIVQRLIALGNVVLIKKIILSGFAPVDMVLSKGLPCWPLKTISPLVVCLFKGSLNLASQLINSNYLTRSDIYMMLSRDQKMFDFLRPQPAELLRQFTSRLPSLAMLSFMSVSSSLGSGPGRKARVDSLELPYTLRDQLLFKSCISVRADMKDLRSDVNLLIRLTDHQVNYSNEFKDFFRKDQNLFDLKRSDEYLNYKIANGNY